ncbi:Lrp/AsnC family transcriptional regulator [Marinomonas epiphytica]
MQLDEKDKKIIALLQLNARTSLADIARQVYLARSTVQERIKRLEQAQVIEGYSLKLNTEQLQQTGILSRVVLSVKAVNFNKVIASLELMSEVRCCESISGKFDLMLEVHTGTPDKLDRLVERVGALPGVERTESSIILRRFFERAI